MDRCHRPSTCCTIQASSKPLVALQAEEQRAPPPLLAGSFQAAAAAGRPSTRPTALSMASTARRRAVSAGPELTPGPPAPVHSSAAPPPGTAHQPTGASELSPEPSELPLRSHALGGRSHSNGSEAEYSSAPEPTEVGSQEADGAQNGTGTETGAHTRQLRNVPGQSGDAAVSVSTVPSHGPGAKVWACPRPC